VGIKIYEGSSANIFNINATFKKPLDRNIVDDIGFEPLRERVKDILEENDDIYVWAGVERAKISFGEKMIFICRNRDNKAVRHPEAFIFTLVDKMFDPESEIHKYVGWKGQKGDWRNVAFYKDQKVISLSDTQFDEIIQLTRTWYRDKRPAGWKQGYQTLIGEQAEKLFRILGV